MKCKNCNEDIVDHGGYPHKWTHQYKEGIYSVFCKNRQGQTLGTYAAPIKEEK